MLGRISSSRMFVWMCVLLLGRAGMTNAYWYGECVRDPGQWALPDNHELDCSLRQLTLTHSVDLLGRVTVAKSIFDGLNGAICNLTIPTAPASVETGVQHTTVATPRVVVARVVVDSTSGSDAAGTTGTDVDPLATIGHALRVARASGPGSKQIVLKAGTYYEQVNLGVADSGTTIAAAVGAAVTLSGGTPLANLTWTAVEPADSTDPNAWGVGAYKARLRQPLPSGITTFTGLFRDGERLTRARFPNCADITSSSCYTLNASGPAGKSPQAPMTALADMPGAMNLEVMNQNGVDMFADTSDSAQATGPHGASDGTLGKANLTIEVDHPDYAWRCHEDCGWVAYSKWRSMICDATDPNGCRFDQTYNQQYWNQQVSGGFFYNASDETWTPRQWSNPSTGVVHMYHSSRWGGWIFQLATRNDSDARLMFACTLLKPSAQESAGDDNRTLYDVVSLTPTECPTDGSAAVVLGGWQEARGGDIGPRYTDKRFNNSYFVENIKEELDFPNEWYFAADEGEHGTLYLMPSSGVDAKANFSDPTTAGREVTLVATMHERVVQIIGSASAPVREVAVENVTIAHAEATFLTQYEIPSGGDWAIKRSAAVFLEGVEEVTIAGCTLDQVDGNGIFLSRYVRNSTVRGNDFFQIGETAILVVGASGMHRTNQANASEYPAFNTIDRNYVAGVGIWNKQSAAYFKSVTRANTVSRNVFHDGPRSGVNFNDGAMGGEVLRDNVLFNYVKESNDHGPFNSWDRQPYIYRVDEDKEDSTLAISPLTQLITRNIIINFNFHGAACGSIAVDHDDESSQYDVNNNVLLYGGVKCFDGMDRHVHDNLVVYPFASPVAGPECFHALSSTRNRSSAHTHFVSNHCVLRSTDFPYNCGAGPAPFYNISMHVELDSNTFSFPGAAAEPGWDGACKCYPGPKTGAPPCPFKTFSDWQAHGHDVHSTIQLTLSNAAIVAEAEHRLKQQ